MGKEIEFYPPQLQFRRGACSWIVREFYVMVSSVYLSKFKIIFQAQKPDITMLYSSTITDTAVEVLSTKK